MDAKVKEVEQIKIRQPNSALYYFDQEKRQEILRGGNVQTAEQAYNLIKSTFDNLVHSNPLDKDRFEKMAQADLERYTREVREQQQVVERYREDHRQLMEQQKSTQQQIMQESEKK